MKEYLKGSKKEEREILKKLAQQILVEANRKSNDQTQENLEILEEWGKHKKPVTLEDLIVCFGRQDVEPIRLANPALSDKDIATLMNDVGEYLLRATKLQQYRTGRSRLSMN